ncbi:MAG TPA: hypothetical protein VMW58_07435 [Anaerolineae bacterium]|nr:hypothetical protein [Anaerolineae bacterium]
MTHIVLSFANNAFMDLYPEADCAARLLFQSFDRHYPDRIDSDRSHLILDADERSVTQALDTCRQEWDRRAQPDDHDTLICTISSHGMRRVDTLEILSDGFTLRKLDQLLNWATSIQVAVLLDCCSWNSPRDPANFESMPANRLYVDVANPQGVLLRKVQEPSAFALTFHLMAAEASKSTGKVTLGTILNLTHDHLSRHVDTRGQGDMTCNRFYRGRVECTLKPGEPLQPFYSHPKYKAIVDVLIQDLIGSLRDEGLSLPASRFSVLTILSENDAILGLTHIIDKVLPEAHWSAAPSFIEYLIGPVVRQVGLHSEDRDQLISHVWRSDRASSEWFFAFLVKGVITLDDLERLADSLAEEGPYDIRRFVVFSAIWESRHLAAAGFFPSTLIVESVTAKLSAIVKRTSLAAAQAAPIDIGYELNIAYQRPYYWYGLGPLAHETSFAEDDVSPGGAPDVFLRALGLVGAEDSPMELPERFRFFAQMAVNLAKGRHWGIACECFRLLFFRRMWSHTNSIWYSAEITDQMDPHAYIRRKALEVLAIMRKAKAPARWQLGLMLDRFQWDYGYIYHGRATTRIANSLSRTADCVLEETLGLADERLLDCDYLLLYATMIYNHMLTDGKVSLSKEARHWVFDKRLSDPSGYRPDIFDVLRILVQDFDFRDDRRFRSALILSLDEAILQRPSLLDPCPKLGSAELFTIAKELRQTALDQYYPDGDDEMRNKCM